MLKITASQTIISDQYVDVLHIQTLAGVFALRELVKGDQPGQLSISSEQPLRVLQDGEHVVIIGTVEGCEVGPMTAMRRREYETAPAL